MNCYNDWASDFMDRAIDQVSGRIMEPKILTEENAWRKTYDYHWNSAEQTHDTLYCWYNTLSGQKIIITREEYQTQEQPQL